MYIVITDNKIAYAKKLQALNRQLQAKLEPEEFKTIGSDHIAQIKNCFIFTKKVSEKDSRQSLLVLNKG